MACWPGFRRSSQALPFHIAEQAAADRRHACQRHVQVDEDVVVGRFLTAFGGVLPARFAEHAVDVLGRQAQVAHRAGVEQGLPRFDRVAGVIDLARGRGGRRGGGRGAGGAGAIHAVGARHRDGRARDAVADHHEGDSGAADDVHRRRRAMARRAVDDVQADVARAEVIDLGLRNADQHDGLVMLHQPGADDAAVVRQRHQHIDGLAGIAASVDHVGGQVDAAQGALAGIGARGHRFALGRADAIGAGEEVGDGNRLQEVGQPLRLDGVRAQRTAQQEN